MSDKTQQHDLVKRIQLKEDPYSKEAIMKLLRKSEPSATLCCELGAVGCHKGVLAARSAHLAELLGRNPCAHPFFYVPGAKHDELQAVAHFMYHGEVDIELSKLRHFYKAVEPLQIRGLQWKNTKEKFEDKVKADDYDDIYRITCVSKNSENADLKKALVVLYDNEEMIDMTLACDDGSFKCHKAVVTACSDYVKNVLSDSCKEPVIFLLGTKKRELEAIIDLMYNGRIKVRKSDVQRVVDIADQLFIRNLSVQSMLTNEKNNEIFQELNSENEHNDSRSNSFDQYPERNADVSSFCPNVAKAFDTPPMIIFDWEKLLQEKSEGTPRRSYGSNERQNVLDAVNRGMSGAQASRLFGIPKSTVYSWLNKYEGLNASKSSAVLNESSSGTTRRSYSDGDRQKVVRAIESGMSVAEAAIKFDIPKSTLYSWMKKSDTLDTSKNSEVISSSPSPSSTTRRSYSDADRQKVLDAVSRGMSGAEASRKYDTPQSTVYSWLRKSDDYLSTSKSSAFVESPPSSSSRRSYSTAEKQSVVNAVNSGMSGAEASRKYDIPSSTVYSWVKKSESPDASRRTSISSSVDTSYSSTSGRRSYTPSERQTVVNAIANGMSGAEAARTYGIPSSTVYSWKNSVPAAPTTNYSHQSNTSYGSSNISYGASNTSYGSSGNESIDIIENTVLQKFRFSIRVLINVYKLHLQCK
ncbi:hypothetical protein TKK_0003333 [Trichogramma kaykai]